MQASDGERPSAWVRNMNDGTAGNEVSMKIRVAEPELLSRILKRKIRERDVEHEVDLGSVLGEILSRANDFVPSEAGSILIDDPLLKLDESRQGRLYFVACFGEGSAGLVGTALPDNVGIIGETYNGGKPYFCEDVSKDDKFYSIDNGDNAYQCRSIICVPIYIEHSIIGVIELINRKDRVCFDRKDLSLLDIFARYTGTFIQNALDARRFEELSKRDNLTGLYNDRYFLQRLTMEINRVVTEGGDVSLIFYDLDSLKAINDTHGHLIGSRVLKEVADVTRNVFAETGAVLTRYGGDEYIVIMPDTDGDMAVEFAERLRSAIAGHTYITTNGPSGGAPLNIRGIVTSSLGVASFNENVERSGSVGDMVESLIRASDSAMYEAKGQGKNKVVRYKGRIG